MLLPKQIRVSLRALPRTTRCLSTTTVRPWATPTNRYPPNDPRGANPVDDIDLVFDYPSEGQTSHQKEPLEKSGLDYHSALPHRPKVGQNIPGAGKMGKEMGATDSNVIYIGLGAVGLGGLYMMMRRRNPNPKSNMTQPGDLAAQKPAETQMERVLGRGR
ncbi:predicted protein [Chaetomium globosum CBS 148.51]|uniref:Uncharacterized protein n=1 Tax=Chaetomium globosum (strain ATCC 6205 / CBS 148.51 / DSM 1962 / NBRC 6347 / NRRL 1970) TaxID=306901 RepID=Q2GUI2_CHAGB|nr:uncharacterized protein CHGG_08372 [Chaetomium globosum CBS 148.51]EAQ84358.1 predicted protein [Chaetomium globosum CBS 148.51]